MVPKVVQDRKEYKDRKEHKANQVSGVKGANLVPKVMLVPQDHKAKQGQGDFQEK